MVVDRQMQILPADPSRIALARAVAGDPVTDPVEFAELLDVDMDDLARGGPLVAADRLGRLSANSRLRPRRLRMRLTVAADTPTSAAICLPVWRCLRKASTAAQTAGVAWLGEESGLEERSCKPSTPSASNRSTHLATVLGVVLNWRAAAALDVRPPPPHEPSSLDLWASKAHSCACPFGPLRITDVWRHQRSRSKPNGQPPESSHLDANREGHGASHGCVGHRRRAADQ